MSQNRDPRTGDEPRAAVSSFTPPQAAGYRMNDAQAIDLIRQMVSIPSVSYQEQAVAKFLVDVMQEAHFSEAFVDEAGNAVGIAEIGGAQEAPPVATVALLGHIDTVPGFIVPKIENGKLHGRGSVDAKGPMASFIAATARLIQNPPSQKIKVLVLGCVEEEAPSSKGARHVIPKYKPDYCIVGEPSGWNGITLGYKGCVRVEAVITQSLTHHAHPLDTAAEKAVAAWQTLHDAADRWNTGKARVFDHILVTLVGLQTSTDGFIDTARLSINVRLPPDLPPEAFPHWFASVLPDTTIQLQDGIAAWSGPRTTRLHREMAKAIRDEGADPRYILKTGTADLNLVAPAWGCPAIAYGPGDSMLDHTPEEHLVLDEYLRSVRILENVLRALPGT